MAGQFDNGVPFYTVGNLDINVYFPGNEVCCQWCPFITHSESLNRDSCRVTGNTIYSRKTVGARCPIVIMNTVKEIDQR